MIHQLKNETGSILLPIIIIMPFLILITALYLGFSISSFKIAIGDKSRTHAQFSVDAGIDFALQEINLNSTWAGTAGEVELQNDGKIRTTYQVVVTNPTAESKVVTSIGRTYSPVAATVATAKVTAAADLRPIKSGEFSIVTGVGGLYLSNSAKVLGGDVSVNGEISMTNSAQIGLSNGPVNVEVAHQICPKIPDATYPRLCNPGENGEPIKLENTAKIYGSVKANNQVTTAGLSSPGLVASSGITPKTLPPHDRLAQIGAITTSVTGAAASCSNGTKTLAANTKITGDFTVSGSCIVTVSGDVWVTGKLTMTNTSQLIVNNSLGTVRPNIMVDGPTVKLSNSSLLKSNINNTGFQVINYWSRAICSPNCSDVTGVELFNSRNDVTIDLDNNASGPQTIFYSKWTRVNISNSGQIGALIGQTVALSNSGTITFGTATGVGSTFWIINGYRRVL